MIKKWWKCTKKESKKTLKDVFTMDFSRKYGLIKTNYNAFLFDGEIERFNSPGIFL